MCLSIPASRSPSPGGSLLFRQLMVPEIFEAFEGGGICINRPAQRPHLLIVEGIQRGSERAQLEVPATTFRK